MGRKIEYSIVLKNYVIYSDIEHPIKIRLAEGISDISSSTNFNGIRDRIMSGEEMKNWALVSVGISYEYVSLVFWRKDGKRGEGHIGFGSYDNKDIRLEFEVERPNGLKDYLYTSTSRKPVINAALSAPIRQEDDNHAPHFAHIFESLNGGQTTRWFSQHTAVWITDKMEELVYNVEEDHCWLAPVTSTTTESKGDAFVDYCRSIKIDDLPITVRALGGLRVLGYTVADLFDKRILYYGDKKWNLGKICIDKVRYRGRFEDYILKYLDGLKQHLESGEVGSNS